VTYIDQHKTRVSSETAYFTEDVLARSNLTVAINATVTRVLFEQEKDGNETRAVGVEFTRSKGGPRYTARAKKEVILWYVSRTLLLSHSDLSRVLVLEAFIPLM
jgi:choline dehydrogenase